jgi:hypothetical protein
MSSRPAWVTWQDPISNQERERENNVGSMCVKHCPKFLGCNAHALYRKVSKLSGIADLTLCSCVEKRQNRCDSEKSSGCEEVLRIL